MGAGGGWGRRTLHQDDGLPSSGRTGSVWSFPPRTVPVGGRCSNGTPGRRFCRDQGPKRPVPGSSSGPCPHTHDTTPRPSWAILCPFRAVPSPKVVSGRLLSKTDQDVRGASFRFGRWVSVPSTRNRRSPNPLSGRLYARGPVRPTTSRPREVIGSPAVGFGVHLRATPTGL